MSKITIADELKALEKDGVIIPEEVVAFAANHRESLCAAHFTWDNTEAATKQRLTEARNLIRTVKVQMTVNRLSLTVVGYVRDPDNEAGKSAYCSVAKIKSDKHAAHEVLIDELKRVNNACERAKRLAKYFENPEVLDEIKARSDALIDELSRPTEGGIA